MSDSFQMQMHAVRLMRSGNYKTAQELLKALREDFPEESDEAVNAAIRELANRMEHNPHG